MLPFKRFITIETNFVKRSHLNLIVIFDNQQALFHSNSNFVLTEIWTLICSYFLVIPLDHLANLKADWAEYDSLTFKNDCELH